MSKQAKRRQSAEQMSGAERLDASTRVRLGESGRSRAVTPAAASLVTTRRQRRLRHLTRAAPLLAAAALLWFGTLGRLWGTARDAKGIDFYDYYTVSRSLGLPPVVEGHDVYSAKAQRALGELRYQEAQASGTKRQREAAKWFRALQPTSSPFTYSMWRTISWLPYDTAFRLFQALGLVAFVGSLAFLTYLLRYPPELGAVLGLALCVHSAALASELRVCNVNRFLVAGLVLLLWLHGRAHASRLTRHHSARHWDLAVGGLMTCLTAFKPTVGPMLAMAWLWLLGRGHYRPAAQQALGAALGSGLCVAIGAARFGGVSAWLQWLTSITKTLSDDRTTIGQGNYAAIRFLEALWPEVAWRACG
ncbi:MAG: glycosyltransferase 87 family protein, partial [Polyangiales bacterium]